MLFRLASLIYKKNEAQIDILQWQIHNFTRLQIAQLVIYILSCVNIACFPTVIEDHQNIAYFINKPTIPRSCIFPIANPHSGESVYFVPPSIVPDSSRFIVDLNHQSSIYTLNKIAQEEAQIVDKQMLF